jgi:hypothetical protein
MGIQHYQNKRCHRNENINPSPHIQKPKHALDIFSSGSPTAKVQFKRTV